MRSGFRVFVEAERQAPARHKAERSIGHGFQQSVAAGASILRDFGLQRNADASLRMVCLMDGVVAPESAVIVPEVMVGFGGLVVLHAPTETQGIGQALS